MKSMLQKSVVISCLFLQSVIVASEKDLVLAAASVLEDRKAELSSDELQQLQQLHQREFITDAPHNVDPKDVLLSEDAQSQFLVQFVVDAIKTHGITITKSGAAAVAGAVKKGCFSFFGKNKKSQEQSAVAELVSSSNQVAIVSRSGFNDSNQDAFKAALGKFDNVKFSHDTVIKTGFLGKVTSQKIFTPIVDGARASRALNFQQNLSPKSRGLNLDDAVKQAVVAAIEGAVQIDQVDPKVALQESLKKQAAHVATQAVEAGLVALGKATGLEVPAGLLVELAPLVTSEIIAGCKLIINEVEKTSCCQRIKKQPAVGSLVALENAANTLQSSAIDSQV